VRHSRLVIARVIGGSSYWPYGIEQLKAVCAEAGVMLALLPGVDQPDPDLTAASSVPPNACHRLWQYMVHGGPENLRNLLGFAGSLIGHALPWAEPRPLLRAGLYWPSAEVAGLVDVRRYWMADRPVAALLFYRAQFQAANLA